MSIGRRHSLAGAQAASRRPNVIAILSDGLGYGDLDCRGSPFATPNLRPPDLGEVRPIRF